MPGKVVQASLTEKFRQRAETARKIGFDAYGQVRDMPDPVSQALDSLLDHAREVEREIAELKQIVGPGSEHPAAIAEETRD